MVPFLVLIVEKLALFVIERLLSSTYTNHNSQCLQNFSLTIAAIAPQVDQQFLYEPSTFTKLISFFLISNKPLHETILGVFKTLFSLMPYPFPANVLPSFLQPFHNLLTPLFQPTWNTSLFVFSYFFEVFPNSEPPNPLIELPECFINLVKSIISIRPTILLSNQSSMLTFNSVMKTALVKIGVVDFSRIQSLLSRNIKLELGIPDELLWLIDLYENSCKNTWGSINFFKTE